MASYIVHNKTTTTNRAAMTDVCEMISRTVTADSEGNDVATGEERRKIFCSVKQGVVRAEYYEALKRGVMLNATIEVWEEELGTERLVEHNGHRYEIERSYPSGYGTIELYCREVTA